MKRARRRHGVGMSGTWPSHRVTSLPGAPLATGSA
jgi:hypothetical protein